MTHVILFCDIQSSRSVLALLTLDVLHLIDFVRTLSMCEQHNKVHKDIIVIIVQECKYICKRENVAPLHFDHTFLQM